MLRRKLLVILASLLAVMMAMAVTAVWLLQGVLSDMERGDREAAAAADTVTDVGQRLATVELELFRSQLGKSRHLNVLLDAMDALRHSAEDLRHQGVIQTPEIAPAYRKLLDGVPEFEHTVGSLAAAQDPDLAAIYSRQAFALALDMHRANDEVAHLSRLRLQQADDGLSARLRWLVLGVSVGFLALINVTILLMVRAAAMILRPVRKLVHASRELGREHFAHRVYLTGNDEFDELAQAYNHLAEQLQANEQRKIEMMQQTALTLNHELNNALAIIEMQLALLTRRASGDSAFEKCLLQIRQSLDRTKHTVSLLRQVRRIVLTDYTNGVKMLDLHRSTQAQEPLAAPGSKGMSSPESVRPTTLPGAGATAGDGSSPAKSP